MLTDVTDISKFVYCWYCWLILIIQVDLFNIKDATVSCRQRLDPIPFNDIENQHDKWIMAVLQAADKLVYGVISH